MTTAALTSHDSVRYVKNGTGGQWWQAAKANGQVHAGWHNIPDELLLKPDFALIQQTIRAEFGERSGATADFNALRCLLDRPSQHLWITFEDGCMWWCTVQNRIEVNADKGDKTKGHFWLACERPWSNRSLGGKRLAITDLPGTVTTVAGFRGTVCSPKASRSILRVIRGDKDSDVVRAADARRNYERAIQELIKKLSAKDFEQLIDLVLARSGWTRIADVGGTREGVDVEVENLAINEVAFVQVKSAATQSVLDDYIGRFAERRDHYARMIFAVHSPSGNLVRPVDPSVQMWTVEEVARLAVRLGLGEWVANKLA